MTRVASLTWLPSAPSAKRVSSWCFEFLGVSAHLHSGFGGFGGTDVFPFPYFALIQENGHRSLCRSSQGIVAIALASCCSTLIQGTHLFSNQGALPGKPNSGVETGQLIMAFHQNHFPQLLDHHVGPAQKALFSAQLFWVGFPKK